MGIFKELLYISQQKQNIVGYVEEQLKNKDIKIFQTEVEQDIKGIKDLQCDASNLANLLILLIKNDFRDYAIVVLNTLFYKTKNDSLLIEILNFENNSIIELICKNTDIDAQILCFIKLLNSLYLVEKVLGINKVLDGYVCDIIAKNSKFESFLIESESLELFDQNSQGKTVGMLICETCDSNEFYMYICGKIGDIEDSIFVNYIKLEDLERNNLIHYIARNCSKYDSYQQATVIMDSPTIVPIYPKSDEAENAPEEYIVINDGSNSLNNDILKFIVKKINLITDTSILQEGHPFIVQNRVGKTPLMDSAHSLETFNILLYGISNYFYKLYNLKWENNLSYWLSNTTDVTERNVLHYALKAANPAVVNQIINYFDLEEDVFFDLKETYLIYLFKSEGNMFKERFAIADIILSKLQSGEYLKNSDEITEYINIQYELTGETAFHCFLKSNNLPADMRREGVKFFLKFNPDVMQQDDEGLSPLMLILQFDDIELFEEILPSVKDLSPFFNEEFKETYGSNILHILAIQPNEIPLRAFLNVLNTTQSEYVKDKFNSLILLSNEPGNTILTSAIRYSSPRTIEMLLSIGVDPNVADKDGFYPIHTAALVDTRNREQVLRSIDILKTLLEHNADINKLDSYGKTALHIAIDKENICLINMLLNLYDDLTILSYSYSIHIIQIAVQYNQIGIVEKMLKFINLRKIPLANRFFIANLALRNDMINIAIRLVSPCITSSQTLDKTQRIVVAKFLYSAIEKYKITSNLLNSFNSKFFINFRDIYNHTLLHIAIEKGCTSAVDLLLAHGANPTVVDFNKNSAIHIALLKGYVDIAKKMLTQLNNYKLIANMTNLYGDTLLHIAAQKNYTDVAEILLEKGNIEFLNKPNFCGFTPLYRATLAGKTEMVKLLLSKEGIDVNYCDIYGSSPIHVAVYQKNYSIVKLLIEAKADINRCTSSDYKLTPLFLAVMANDYTIVKELLKYGASTRIRNAEGITPLQLAGRRGYLNIARLLVDASPRLTAIQCDCGIDKLPIKVTL